MLNPISKRVGKYPAKELLVASSYVQLVHAALEVSLEQAAIAVAQRCGSDFIKKNRLRPELLSLVGYYLTPRKFPKDGDIFQPLAKAAVEAHVSALGRSHGIRMRNIAAMFNPLGLRPADSHSTLVTAWNAFGVFRGAIAHNGISAFNQDPVDKRAEVENQIVPQTKAFIDSLKF